MTVVQTVLVFIGIPVGIVLVLFLLVYGRSLVRQPNRYRPGRPWDFAPSWFVPHPEVTGSTAPAGATTATGGASGEW